VSDDVRYALWTYEIDRMRRNVQAELRRRDVERTERWPEFVERANGGSMTEQWWQPITLNGNGARAMDTPPGAVVAFALNKEGIKALRVMLEFAERTMDERSDEA
jgi:hypothetical protein